MTDPISDMLTRIRNGAMVRKSHVDVPRSKMKYSIAKILESAGYLAGVEDQKDESRPMLRLALSYDDARRSTIASIKRVSTPGRRIYAKADELPIVQSGIGMAIVSTPNGLMTSHEARKRRLGGEVICEVF